jgi:prophage regulatory protein
MRHGVTMSEIKFLTFAELKAVRGIPYSRMHLDRLIKKGRFPRKVHLGDGRMGWIDREIHDYLLGKMAERNQVPA